MIKPGAFLHQRDTTTKGAPLTHPVVHAATYHLPGDPDDSRHYGRPRNATWEALEAALSDLEAADAVVFPSGMAAISAALMVSLKAGARLLLPEDGYYMSRRLADDWLARFGVQVETRATARFTEGGFAGFDAVLVESPSNPGLDLVDLAALAREVRAAGGISITDNTTMTPLGQRPLDLGIDICVASDTKAPGGHSDTLMGHAAARDPQIAQSLRDWRNASGAIPGPQEAWQTLRGLETLELRLDRMSATALTLAERLQTHPSVSALRYPGLPTDPSHALAKAQMRSFGTLIGFNLSSADAAEQFINTCPLLRAATSFGGVHSSAERRGRWGDAVAPGFVRLSVGIEPADELWEAIKTALDAL